MACSDKEASRARPFSSGGEAFSLAQRERHDATGKVQTPQDRNGQHQPAKRRQLAHSVRRQTVEQRVIENRPRDAKVVFARLVFGERRAAVAGWISEAPRGCRIAAIRTGFHQSPHTQLLVGQHCVNHLVEYLPVRPSCLITSPRAEPSGHRSDDISRKSKMPIPAKSSNGAWDNVTGLRVARIGSCAELLISAARLLRPGGAPS